MPHHMPRIALVLFMASTFAACDEVGEGTPVSAFNDLFAQDTVVHLETSASDPLGLPAGIAVWDGRLAVSDPFASNVKVFDSDGTLRVTVGRHGDGPGEFLYPASLVVDDRGLLAVLDELSGTVSYFRPDGTFVEAFRFVGGWTGGMSGAFQGTKLVIGTRLVGDDRRVSSEHVVHLFDHTGHREGSFGELAVPQAKAEAPFTGMHLTVVDDSLAAWGTVGRRTIYIRPLGDSGDVGSVTDSVLISEIAPVDWGNAPSDDGELFQWVVEYELLTGVFAAPGVVVARYQGGDARRGEAWYRYALISIAERRVVAVTDRTPSRIVHMAEGAAFGVSIEDDGEAYLTRYRPSPAYFPEQ